MTQKYILALRNERADSAVVRPYPNKADGEGVVLTYSFMTALPETYWTGNGNPASSFEAYSASERAVVRKALAMISSVANVAFVETTQADSDFAFGQYNIPGMTIGYADPLDSWKATGDVTMQSQVWLDSRLGLTTQNVLHEVGHVLGLDHTDEGQHRLSRADDNRSNTVMSYQGNAVNKLGPFDILALQEIYGAAPARTGNNTYVFGKDKLIWDGGGIDTISAASAKKAVKIDLDNGSWNYIGSKSSSLSKDGQVILSNSADIENLTGSRYNDNLSGNGLANKMLGGSGNDRITGDAGDDRLYGQAGNDVLNGGLGNDYLNASSGNDQLIGGWGADVLIGGSGSDRFTFSAPDHLGDLTSFDRIRDFTKSDKIDFRGMDANPDAAGRQKLKFTGNFATDDHFSAGRKGEFYYNKVSDKLVFDFDGDNVADHYFGVAGVNLMKSDYFLL
ncbi:M10 family metallopeptidase C-terminal domain-containing protein [Microvirga tunisiensis]|uniref:Peptidase metallopeptidase domain-containing protein n=1 Tax=Microvirga tunisiensis TaxID=2108360 RepID=A0A5N7MCZ9_9HYPH|nr:M10 family metallopeptidase C-terminal domain-containing protein [Microvirga tunisiensis]MPR08138.1 hypothetical protein [Microvirga tunisiensis]MPR24149.1 hypothetical protein [Microvirga tunisiensis]